MAKPAKYWDKRAIRRLTDAEKQSEEYITRIQKMYDRANRNIQRDIENVYRNYSKSTGLDVQSLKELLTASETEKLWAEMKRKGLDKYVKGNYKARISRLEKIQAQIYAKAKEIYPEEQLQHTMCYEGVINNSYYKAIYDTQMGTGFDFAFSKIDDNMVSALLNEPWSGKNYSARIWGNTDILADSVAEIVGGALISGQSIEKTSRQIRERFNVAKYYADRLVRTETNHFNNEADALAYEEMDVDKYVFLATLDTRTSTMCQEMDNKVIPIKERQVGVNYPPLHPNCRSKTRAYMGEEIEKTLQRRARNPITGKNEVIGNMSYKEWAKQHGLDKPTPSGNQPLPNSANGGTIPANKYGFNAISGAHTIDDDIVSGGVPTCNPHYNRADAAYSENCQRCVPTYEYRRRGFDVVAKPVPLPRAKDTILWGNECFIDQNGNVPQYTLGVTLKQLADELNNAPDGARYSIYAVWKKSKRAHVFVAETTNSGVRFIDPQNGRTDAMKYLVRAIDGRFGFLRMDDKQLTTDMQIISAVMEGRK